LNNRNNLQMSESMNSQRYCFREIEEKYRQTGENEDCNKNPEKF